MRIAPDLFFFWLRAILFDISDGVFLSLSFPCRFYLIRRICAITKGQARSGDEKLSQVSFLIIFPPLFYDPSPLLPHTLRALSRLCRMSFLLDLKTPALMRHVL